MGAPNWTLGSDFMRRSANCCLHVLNTQLKNHQNLSNTHSSVG